MSCYLFPCYSRCPSYCPWPFQATECPHLRRQTLRAVLPKIIPKVLLFTHVTFAKPFRVATFVVSSCLSYGADIQAASSAVRHD